MGYCIHAASVLQLQRSLQRHPTPGRWTLIKPVACAWRAEGGPRRLTETRHVRACTSQKSLLLRQKAAGRKVHPAGATHGLVFDGAVSPSPPPVDSGRQHVVRQAHIVHIWGLVLCPQLGPRPPAVGQHDGHILLMRPIRKLIHSQPVTHKHSHPSCSEIPFPGHQVASMDTLLPVNTMDFMVLFRTLALHRLG